MDSWVTWTIILLLVIIATAKFVEKASDDWSSRNYDEYHFNGYEDPYWRK